MIYCTLKGWYVDQENTCIKKECQYYKVDTDSCKAPEEKIELPTPDDGRINPNDVATTEEFERGLHD